MKIKGDTLGTVERISAYDSVYKLLEENDFISADLSADQDFCDFLRNCDDYECIGYFCVNDSTIICTDSINGDVISVCSADELIAGLKEQYEEYFS